MVEQNGNRYIKNYNILAETILVTRTQRIHIPFNETVSYFCHLSEVNC